LKSSKFLLFNDKSIKLINFGNHLNNELIDIQKFSQEKLVDKVIYDILCKVPDGYLPLYVN